MTYKAFIPIVEIPEQGWDMKVGVVVPLKVKLRHMQKTIVGLLLATAANKARLDSTTRILLHNYRDLTDLQRVGLRCLLGLKALLYCPALLALGVLVPKCNWNGRTASSTTAAILETAKGKVLKEEGRLEVLPLSCGCRVPIFPSARPFVCCLIEVPHVWTLAMHNIVAQFLPNGVLIFVTGETNPVTNGGRGGRFYTFNYVFFCKFLEKWRKLP